MCINNKNYLFIFICMTEYILHPRQNICHIKFTKYIIIILDMHKSNILKITLYCVFKLNSSVLLR